MSTKEIDLNRSYLLHRLTLLEIPWGVTTSSRGEGTFKEAWLLEWRPEITLQVIERARWGQSVEDAAVAYCLHQAQGADLAKLTSLAHRSITAHLPRAISSLMRQLETQAAVTSDIAQLLSALPPLAELARYSDVRGSEVAVIDEVLNAIAPRASIGLGLACHSLDDQAAERMTYDLDAATQALQLVNREELLASWYEALIGLAQSESTHGRVRGKVCRLLNDAQELDHDQLVTYMSLALSRAVTPDQSAAWLEGFLSKSGQILVYDDALWSVVDEWVCGLSGEAFIELLPLIRRTFSTFTANDLRQLGARVKDGGQSSMLSAAPIDIDVERAVLVLPLIQRYLGLAPSTTEGTHE